MACLHADSARVSDAPAFTFFARRPFHPLRFYCLLHSPWPQDIIARGCFWIATRPDYRGEFVCIGGAARHRAGGTWWATLSEGGRAALPAAVRAMFAGDWHPVFGDRRQEIAFTGVEAAPLRRMLEGCLVDGSDDVKTWNAAWASLPDPFPAWDTAGAGTQRAAHRHRIT